MKNESKFQLAYANMDCSKSSGHFAHVVRFGKLCFKIQGETRNGGNNTRLYLRNSEGEFVFVASDNDFKDINHVDYILNEITKERMFEENIKIVKDYIKCVYGDMA